MKKNTLLVVAALITSHLCALGLGSSLQHRSQKSNSHAHLSDVTDAITLGEYFAQAASVSDEQRNPAKATAAIIYRILGSATPGPNSKARLQKLEAELRTKYPDGPDFSMR